MSTSVKYRSAAVDGHNVFYREAGDPRAPKIVLFGGFPSSSHQWRDLIPALASRGFHVVSPDHPGFGHTTSPDGFAFTFDNLSEVIEKWLIQIGFTSFGLYHQDYGGPIGNRIVARHPEWLQWQIVRRTATPTRRVSPRPGTASGSSSGRTATPRPRTHCDRS